MKDNKQFVLIWKFKIIYSSRIQGETQPVNEQPEIHLKT